ncbi:hypothetical protein O6H91_12G097500 [Diphasiastrum complanatum]|uniref:Uncharacterized protein n=2 Tax=Diphasiastrum complanatum TaxID=34168 RepID=A0ACC2C564_DIPCM|nr:hypothetical protein O6H91_12G097500 [Diphasiastrum complanatum]
MEEIGDPRSADRPLSSVYGTTHQRCQKMIHHSLSKNPMVKFMRQALDTAGCPVGDKFFKATTCEKVVGGGFQSDLGVVICCNHVLFQKEVDMILTHELIHAYDHCRAKNLDWSNCEHHACSEIRAANLSGDCHFKQEFNRGNFGFQKHHQVCVKRRALLSVAMNPNCSKSDAESAIDAVWSTCYKDTQPFDRVP